MQKVLITARAYGQIREPVEELKKASLEVQEVYGKLTMEDLVALVKEADAAIVGMERMDEAVFSSAPRLKIVARAGVGHDNVDVAAATRHGIVATNVAGVLENAASEMSFALMLALARRIPTCDSVVRAGRWDKIIGWELRGKTLGLLGMGKIGKGVATRAKAFEMNVMAYDLMPDRQFAADHGIVLGTLEEVLSQADFVTLHLPLTPATRSFIGDRELRFMKPTAFLINASRGGVVDEDALCQALTGERLRGAAIDVFEKEPPSNNPLLHMDNVVLSPHVGGSTFESLGQVAAIAARNVIAVLAGNLKDCRFILNPEVTKVRAG